MTLTFTVPGSLADALHAIAEMVEEHDLKGRVQFSGIPLVGDPKADWQIDITELDVPAKRLITADGEFHGLEAMEMLEGGA